MTPRRASYPAQARRLLLTTDAVGGVWRYSLTLARRLSDSGVSVLLAVLGPEPSHADRREALSIPALTLLGHPGKLEWMDEPWQGVDEAGQWLLDLERTFRPDIVHLNGYSHAELPFRVPVVCVAHSCVLSWWEAVLGEPAPARYAEYRRRVSRGLSHAARVVAPTQAMLAALVRTYGAFGSGTVIHNGIEPLQIPPSAKEPFVFAAGRAWDPAKNLSVLDEAAGLTTASIDVAGDTRAPDGSSVQVQFSRLTMLGRLGSSAMAERLARAAIFAHPARYEPFGLAPLEAARSGAALLLADIDSLREVWGSSALYAAPSDPSAWAAGIDRLMTDDQLRERMAEEARAQAARYSAAKMGAAYLQLYARLLRERGQAMTGTSLLGAASGLSDPATLASSETRSA